MKTDKIFFELSPKDTVVKNVETSPSLRRLGGDPDVYTDKIRIYIGSRPVAFDLKKLYKKLDKQVPPEIDIFKSYNAFIISYSVGIIKEGGIDSVKQVGYRVKFPTGIDAIVLDVMPQSKFVKLIDGNFNFDAEFNLNGELSIPSELTEFLQENVEYVGVGGKLKASTDNKVVGRFSFSVQTPEIQAIGKGNSYSEWVFNKNETPLYGKDFEMFQIILVDRFEETLTFEAKVYATISSWSLIPIRRESDWVPINCTLS